MKKTFVLIILSFCLLVSCKKSDNKCVYAESSVVANGAEIVHLQNYLAANAIVATQHSSGIFYSIHTAGTGTVPQICSNVKVKYTASILGGAIVESNMAVDGITYILGQLILGCQKGLPLIRPGGSITLYIPPSMAYGNVPKLDNLGNVLIPASSYLQFDFNLLDVL